MTRAGLERVMMHIYYKFIVTMKIKVSVKK